jgi:hypothetical protein
MPNFLFLTETNVQRKLSIALIILLQELLSSQVRLDLAVALPGSFVICNYLHNSTDIMYIVKIVFVSYDTIFSDRVNPIFVVRHSLSDCVRQIVSIGL